MEMPEPQPPAGVAINKLSGNSGAQDTSCGRCGNRITRDFGAAFLDSFFP